jgi:hypothetical protein
MSEKLVKTRIVNKHDLEVNWLKATNFVPLKGELVVYDIEVDAAGNTLTLPNGRTTPYTYERCKIGDGKKTVTDLPFVTDAMEDYVDAGLANKVDKVNGKGLSTNDYTTTEKNKLAGIASGAEVNVQADWKFLSGGM